MVLIRTTLIAINQGNLTGNYSVVRDLGSVEFRNTTSVEAIANSLKPFRDQGLDLSAVVAITPSLDEPPVIDPTGKLILAGHVPTSPLRVEFRLAFAWERGRWYPAGLALGTRAVSTEPTLSD